MGGKTGGQPAFTAMDYALALTDRGWSPDGVAFLVSVMDDEDGDGARIARRFMRVPQKRRRSLSEKQPIPQSFRTAVFERDAYRCVLCGDWHGLQVDHIVPESMGGPLTMENCQTLCRSCNVRKGARV